MILATSSGWLISVDKLSETDHTVTIQDRHERTAPYTISKSDHNRKLFNDVVQANEWIDNHPARKEVNHENQ